MFEILKKIWNYTVVFIIASVFSFGLFYLFLHPLSLGSFISARLSLASLSSNSATVPLNPFNKLAMQLEAKEKELAQLEKDLVIREEKIEKRNNPLYNRLLLIIIVVLIALVVSILLNFYFDSRRKKRLKQIEEGQKNNNIFKV